VVRPALQLAPLFSFLAGAASAQRTTNAGETVTMLRS
jgi:hypothetical protein